MRYILSITICAALIFGLYACKKNEFNLKNNIFIENKASLKVNTVSSFAVNPLMQIKVDGKRVSSNITYFTPFPGGGLNTGGGSYADYLGVDPGQRKISVSMPFSGTNNDSVEVASTTVDLVAGKNYSVYFADTGSNATSLILEDDNTPPDSGYCKYRFINLIPNSPAAGYDLYLGTGSTSTTSTKVATVAGYKSVAEYFTVPLSAGTVWSIRPAGALATTTALVSYTSASSVVNQRVFTIITRGYDNITATTDVRRRAFSFIYNR